MLELPLVVGFVLVPIGLLVVTAPTWIERQTAARDAAAEVGRAIALGGADADVTSLVDDIAEGYGLDPDDLVVDVVVAADEPGGEIVVRVSATVPAVWFPVFGEVGQATLVAEHRERRPDYGPGR